MDKNIVLKTENIDKYFYDPVEFQVLKNIGFEVERGEFLTLIGKSGSGKSTLLYILSTMDRDYNGNLVIDNELITGKSVDELATIRNEKIGFVFQFHYLLSEFTCLKNVMIPALKLGKFSPKEIEERAYEKLKMLGMEDQAFKAANKLSGGQQQRVAIARALINDPLIIMGDEPTGNLDKKNSDLVFDIFKKLASELNQSLLVVTHDNDFANRTNRIITMEDGQII